MFVDGPLLSVDRQAVMWGTCCRGQRGIWPGCLSVNVAIVHHVDTNKYLETSYVQIVEDNKDGLPEYES